MKNQKSILIIIGTLSILAGIALIVIMILVWPLSSYYAYYLDVTPLGVWIILICIMIGGGIKIFTGIRLFQSQQQKPRKLIGILMLSIILLGISIGGMTSIIPDLYILPDLVSLSTFDNSDWESFNATEWTTKNEGYYDHLHEIWGDFPALVSLNPQQLSEEQEEGYRRIKMQIQVEDSGRSAWDYMSFYILIPDQPKATPTPCMIIFHQHDGAFAKGKEEPVGLLRDPRQAFALELVKRGYITVAADALCFSERQEVSEYRTSKMLLTLNRTLNGKYVWDISRLLDYLVTRSEINTTRIGIMGHSLGGQMAIYCAAYDPRIALVVSNCGIGKINGKNSILENPGEDNEAFYLQGLAAGPYAMDMKEIIGLIDSPLVLANGVKDHGLPIQGVAEIHAWVEQKCDFYGQPRLTIRHNAAHGIFPNTKALMYDFIDQYL
jgi:dienelactone hydrolase